MDSYNEQMNWMRLSTPDGLLFSIFSAEEIRKLSVVKIITPLSFDSLSHPLPGGLYDPAMGPLTATGVCTTCGMMQMKCNGHFGHIDLPVPVLNPLYHKPVAALLKMACLNCARILIPHAAKCLLIGQCTLLHRGYLVEAQEMENVFMDLVKASTWDRAQSDVECFEAATKINDFVTSVCSEKEHAIKEWKGEADLRNAFIRNANSKLFKGHVCPYCKMQTVKISTVKNCILIPTKLNVAGKFRGKKSKNKDPIGDIAPANFSFLMPAECKELLTRLFEMDGEFIKALLPVLVQAQTKNPIDSLFMEVVPVTPIATRPTNVVDGKMLEHPSNCIYQAILNDCLVLRTLMLLVEKTEGDETEAVNQLNTTVSLSKERCDIVEQLRGKSNSEKFQYAWQELQKNVDSLMDVDTPRGKVLTGIGLKQILEKKEGIIRMNMMGKRVNFAARTVITPDPNLNIDEIGVPEAFAKKLSYPVPVTYFNVKDLRKMVINGPFLHPGANYIENEDGTVIKLDGGDLLQREGLAKKLLTPSDKKGIKIVHRHVINGDVLLFNRQPTLHKPSIMAHRARVLKGEKTFRMHYANCKSYNADFDGDEMNAHLPQNEVARSEGYNLVSVSKQYLVPKDGTPLSGLIQDHVVSGVRLTMRGQLFTREEYMQLCFQGLSSVVGNIKCLPPCMIKPVQLWSGKQIVSTVILNLIPRGSQPINLTSTSKIRADAWLMSQGKQRTPSNLGPKEMSEAEVIIRGGELLCGILDKMHYGATPYSLVHCMHELYGSEVAAKLLSAFSKLFTAFLQTEGFTLGVEDILVVKDADSERREIIDKVRSAGDELAAKSLNLESHTNLRQSLSDAHRKDKNFLSLLDHTYKVALDKFTNEINKSCLPRGLHKKFPANDLQLMVESGAKGSTVNTMQISCLLGQIELEGRRPPLMISGRSLPSFPPFDTSPRSGGFVDGRFMTGIPPQEFFFHCMAGREGLIDTAVKTSRSGYLQRCLVKHLEGLSVKYDLTVRDSDGSVIQFLYGEDGLEVNKCQFINEKQLPFLACNVEALLVGNIAEELKAGSDLKKIERLRKKLKKWRNSNLSARSKCSPFSLYSQEALESVKPSNKFNRKTGRSKVVDKIVKNWYETDPETKARFQKMTLREPDTLVSKLQPDRHFGSVSEKLDAMMNNYLKSVGRENEAEILEEVVHLKAISALANPGEPVGLLAAQSIGEPSTQMTLNTFHFAGRGEMNVTLGIPRLREILMVASKNIKTPSMEIPFRPNLHKLYTNDIHAVAESYGIEAANKVIVKEVQEVFKVYGITVDPRHLSLVADYMTFDGVYRPLNRVGMEGGSSPLQQMSFEAATGERTITIPNYQGWVHQFSLFVEYPLLPE
ncbi:unnamed protein product [Nesidiocoris tenuis]|uniref:DNA-directed RNA polymerase subunit n=1 Tax=Nesidiocoris tenuis TaxID=355587 RepID=A0A6H5GYC8_9HEMI|nr:unnamed protein product [Nesidiocoris tenuis]